MMFDFSKQGVQDFLHELRHGLQGKRPDDLSQSQLRSMMESILRKLQLVSREEFDAQQAVLLRTRMKLEELEREVVKLQMQMTAKAESDNPGNMNS